jgi:hypothetical protein
MGEKLLIREVRLRSGAGVITIIVSHDFNPLAVGSGPDVMFLRALANKCDEYEAAAPPAPDAAGDGKNV